MTLPLAALCLSLAPSRALAARLRVEPSTHPTQWTIAYGAQTVLVYEFDPQQFKPYVKELNTIDGRKLLRDAPADHLHHHALMYGIKVNGLNFWEEISGSGVQRVVQSPPPELAKTADGLPQARLVQTIYWLAPADAFLPVTIAPALLVEQRTLTLSLDPKRSETALHWHSAFELGAKTNLVALTGANYHGLGIRFLQELDPLASHFTPSGAPDLSGSKQDVSLHDWEAVAFNHPKHPATLAVFGSPRNARGPSAYFAMKTPFAYLSATQGLDREPLVYKAGDRFELDYLVTVYPAVKAAEALAERDRQWKASLR